MGNPVRKIVQVAKEERTDLIVLAINKEAFFFLSHGPQHLAKAYLEVSLPGAAYATAP